MSPDGHSQETVAPGDHHGGAVSSLLGAALAQLTEGVIVTDTAGRISFVNEAAAQLHGVARLDVPPEEYADTYHLLTEEGDPYPSTELPLARAVLQGESVLDARWRIRRPDGSEIFAIGSARRVYGASGEPLGAVLTVRDDSARVMRERAERRSALILEQVADEHITMDHEFRILSINRAALKALGGPAERWIGRTHWEAFPASVGSDVERQYRRVVNDGEATHLVHHYVGEGYDRHIEIDAYPAADGGVAVFWREISDRVHAQAALREQNEQLSEQAVELELAVQQLQETAAELEASNEELRTAGDALAASEGRLRVAEQQLRTLADTIPTLAWTARADGYIDWYNARWYEYTGTTPEQMAGWGWQSVHDAGTLTQVMQEWQASIATGNVFEMTFPLRGANGSFRRFLTRVAPIRDSDGHVVRWFGTNTDVEAERAAREAAESANQAKTDFLATMSHELRTPLNAIAGYAELLELGIHGPISDDQRTAVTRIQRSQRHLLGLINDVLNFAKLEAGRVEFRISELRVRDALDALHPLVAPQLHSKQLRFTRAGAAEDVPVLADPEKLQQVLINLMSNAIKFTGAGGAVSIESGIEGDRVHIHVRDTGIGIAAERLDDVFAPFVQVDRRLNAPHEGAGLGLAISRDLARGMGGELRVSSVVGEGTTFTVELPRGGGSG